MLPQAAAADGFPLSFQKQGWHIMLCRVLLAAHPKSQRDRCPSVQPIDDNLCTCLRGNLLLQPAYEHCLCICAVQILDGKEFQHLRVMCTAISVRPGQPGKALIFTTRTLQTALPASMSDDDYRSMLHIVAVCANRQ